MTFAASDGACSHSFSIPLSDRSQSMCRGLGCLAAGDREKERLGRELHDGLCQSLAGIAALSAGLSRRAAAHADSTTAAMADEIAQLLHQAIGEARDLAHGLGPIGLRGEKLADALSTLSRNTSALFCIACTVTCDRRASDVDERTGLHLYRIVQEAVRNAVSHGGADRIEISLTCDGRQGRLDIRDNGEGLPEGADTHDGVGLRSMDYRACAIGGALTLASQPPFGAVVTCMFPLPWLRDDRSTLHHETLDA